MFETWFYFSKTASKKKKKDPIHPSCFVDRPPGTIKEKKNKNISMAVSEEKSEC